MHHWFRKLPSQLQVCAHLKCYSEKMHLSLILVQHWYLTRLKVLVRTFLGLVLSLPLLTSEELFVPPEDVDEADGDVVICCWGDESIELRPPETDAFILHHLFICRNWNLRKHQMWAKPGDWVLFQAPFHPVSGSKFHSLDLFDLAVLEAVFLVQHRF